MIHYKVEKHNETPFVVITFEKSPWDPKQLDQAFNGIQDTLLQNGTNSNAKLMIIGNPEVPNPPLSRYPKLIKNILAIKDVAAMCSNSTAIVNPEHSFEGFFKCLFKVFKPKNPMAFVENIDDAFSFLTTTEAVEWDPKRFRIVKR